MRWMTWRVISAKPYTGEHEHKFFHKPPPPHPPAAALPPRPKPSGPSEFSEFGGRGYAADPVGPHAASPDCLLMVHLYTTAAAAAAGPHTASPDCLLMVHLCTTAAAAVLLVGAVHGLTRRPLPYTALRPGKRPRARHPRGAAPGGGRLCQTWSATSSNACRTLDCWVELHPMTWLAMVTRP
jgi:hypothetical protein